MKKKSIGKIILITILIILVIFVIVRIYHYQILKKISDATIVFSESENYNLRIRETGIDFERMFEYYKKDGKAYDRTFYKTEDIIDDCVNISMLDAEMYNVYSTDNAENSLTITTCAEEIDTKVIANFHSYRIYDNDMFVSDLKSKISNLIQDKIMYSIVFTEEYNGKECYVFNQYSTIRYWIDKETLLPLKVQYEDSDNQVYLTDYYEYDVLSDNVIKKPNPKDYETVTYYDGGEQVYDNWNELAEEPISGTNLKPNELLIENVEIKDGEELNFLGLTPDDNEIVSFEIYSYDTYNKFRTKYSGLRELTEKDFENYFVSIAFKEGYKLEYIEHWESDQENITNFIVSSKKEEKDNFTLFVLPKSTGNRRTNYVENDKKISIGLNDAVEKIQEHLEEFGEFYKLENMDFMGYKNDVICRLTNEKFAELDYIRNAVKGTEPICWRIDYCVYRPEEKAFGYLNIYIDATTGELIGSKADY